MTKAQKEHEYTTYLRLGRYKYKIPITGVANEYFTGRVHLTTFNKKETRELLAKIGERRTPARLEFPNGSTFRMRCCPTP